MNKLLDPISNNYEGILNNRSGHNFPFEYVPKEHAIFKYKDKCQYVIGIYLLNDLAHELLHAKYYLDATYKTKIDLEWKAFPSKIRTHITKFLTRLGYSDKVIIDEYQAYRYTEKSNFFGIKLDI